MAISIFELFSIGIGPSSSHTVGPMRAARRFVVALVAHGSLDATVRIKVELYGSLALTGKGHGTDKAILLGLEGKTPEGVDPDEVPTHIALVFESKSLMIDGKKEIPFNPVHDLVFHFDKQLPFHPNGMRFTAYDANNKELSQQVYYSVGGGFIVDHLISNRNETIPHDEHQVPYPFATGQQLLEQCSRHGFSVPQLMMENEKSWKSEGEIREGLLTIWQAMEKCTLRGINEEGILPGGLNVQRRAKSLHQKLVAEKHAASINPASVMEWVSLWALAVNEENAAGGRVVTAPTNGAAGVIPAVIHYYHHFIPNATEEGIINFLLTAGAIGILYKVGASISAAEMGCMGEVGVACSMAAGGLVAALNGSVEQVENAAEIGMEHNLGLTCDPIMGLVQIPCIERNTMGAVKAVTAAHLALRGDGSHRVSLDQVIATMRQTGKDMKSIYKETSLGGLAVNVPEC